MKYVNKLLILMLLLVMIPNVKATDINECTTINTNGTYLLTTDIIDSGNVTCINITSNNVTLDCQGFTIDGVDNSVSYGIFGKNISNIIIKNCIISDWGTGGLGLNVTNNITVDNMTAFSQAYDAVDVEHSSNITIKNSNLSANTHYGIHWKYVDYSEVINTSVDFERRGMYLFRGIGTNITNVTMNDNTDNGILLIRMSNTVVSQVNVRITDDAGISISFSNETIIEHANISGSIGFSPIDGIIVKNSLNTTLKAVNITGYRDGIDGISAGYSPQIFLNNVYIKDMSERGIAIGKNSVINNTIIISTGSYGIVVVGSGTNITSSTVTSATKYGIFLNNAENSTISSTRIFNTVVDTTARGIFLNYSDNNVIYNLTSNNNTYYGIYLDNSGTNKIYNSSFANEEMGVAMDNSDSNNFTNIYGKNTSDIFLLFESILNVFQNITSENTLYLGSGSHNNTINDSNTSLYLDASCSWNKIYNNILNSVSGADNGNYWNTTKTSGTNIIGGSFIGGNFWKDLSCNDTNVDGICDESYMISSGNIDYLPLAQNDTVAPVWSTNSTNIVNNYSSTNKSYFNITWTDYQVGTITGINTTLIEGNWSGSAHNYTMTHLGSGIYNFSTILPAGTFYWISCANDSAGNLNCTDKWVFTVNKASTVTTNLIDGSNSDISKSIGSTINFTSYASATGLNVTLYINGTLSGNNITRIENISDTTGWSQGNYNITAYTLENENYTGSSSTHTLTLTSMEVPSYSNIKPQTPYIYEWDNEYQINITWEWNISAPIDTVFLEYGGSNITAINNQSISGTSAEFYYSFYNLSAGNYNYVWWANNSLGNWAKTPTQTLTVSKANPESNMVLVASPSWNVYSDQSIVIQGSELNNGDDDLEYNLTRNGNNVTNPYSATESVGTYTFIYTTAGGENYTSGTLQRTLSVSTRPSVMQGGGGGPKEELTIPDSVTFIVEEGGCQQINVTFTWSDISSKYIFVSVPENATEYLVKPKSGDRYKVNEGANEIEFLACLPEDLPQILPQGIEWLNQTIEQLRRGVKFSINISWDGETQELPIFIYLKESKKEIILPNIYLPLAIIIFITILAYFVIPTEEI
ncbi:MAG: NosD domain-containing protein [Candidatus Helarchaeota archaeon]